MRALIIPVNFMHIALLTHLLADLKIGKVVDTADVHGKTVSNEQKQVINEEALIKEAVHEAMTKVVEQTGGIVRHAVQVMCPIYSTSAN